MQNCSIPPVLKEDEGKDTDYNGRVGEHLGGAEDGVPGIWVDDSRYFSEAL